MNKALTVLLLLLFTMPSHARICDRRPNGENYCAGCDGLTVAWAWYKDGIWCNDCMGQYCPPLYGQEKNLACEGQKVEIPDGFITAISIDASFLDEITKANPYIGTRIRAFVPINGTAVPLAFPGTARTVWIIDPNTIDRLSEDTSEKLPAGEYIEVTGEVDRSDSGDDLRVKFAARHYFPSGDALLIGPRISLSLSIDSNMAARPSVIDEYNKFATLYNVKRYSAEK